MSKPNHYQSGDTELKTVNQSSLIAAAWSKPHQVDHPSYSKPDAYSFKSEDEQYDGEKVQRRYFASSGIVFTKKKIALIAVVVVGVLVLSICLPVLLTNKKTDDAQQQRNTTSPQSAIDSSNNTSSQTQKLNATKTSNQMPSATLIKQIAGEMITTYYTHDSESQNCKTILTLRDDTSPNKIERNVTASSCLTVPIGQYSYKTVDTALLYIWQPTCFKQGNVSAITLNNTYINVTHYLLPATSIFSVSC